MRSKMKRTNSSASTTPIPRVTSSTPTFSSVPPKANPYPATRSSPARSEEHTSELQSRENLVCRLLLDSSTTGTYPLSLHDALPIWISEVVTKQGEGIVHVQHAFKNEKDELFSVNNAYTTCDLEHPHFLIRSTKSKSIPGDKIVSG